MLRTNYAIRVMRIKASRCFSCFPFFVFPVRVDLNGGTTGGTVGTAFGGSGKPNNPKAAEGEESSMMKSREGVRWEMRLGTVWSVLVRRTASGKCKCKW